MSREHRCLSLLPVIIAATAPLFLYANLHRELLWMPFFFDGNTELRGLTYGRRYHMD